MKIVDIIQYEGDNSTFIWKHPVEDFNVGTQLIVHESQEALFFSNGQALDLFGPGRHTLKTQNIPLLRRLQSIPTDGNTPFHCEVYFINKAEQMAIKWGTDSQVEYFDPVYKFPIKIGASGEMSLSVENSRKLLVKLVGTEKELSRATLLSYFRGILMSRAKQYIAEIMRAGSISIFEVDEKMGLFSDELKARITPDFLDYGIALPRFFVTTIVKPEGDPDYKRFKSIFFEENIGIREEKLQQQRELIRQQTKAQQTIIEAGAMAQKRSIEGYSYADERRFNVAEKLAQNESVGNFTNAGIGLGMMAGVGGGMGAAVAGMVSDVMNPVVNSIPSDGFNMTEAGGFTSPIMLGLKEDSNEHTSTQQYSAASASTADTMAEFKQKMEKLKFAKEMGVIDDAEFTMRKNAIMKEAGLGDF